MAQKEGYSTKVTLKHFRISPRKARTLINLIKGKQVEPAMQILKFNGKKSAVPTLKLLRSAVSNAKEAGGVDIDKLWITGGSVDMGRTMKRYMPGAHGRANLIKKRSAHITLYLSERI